MAGYPNATVTQSGLDMIADSQTGKKLIFTRAYLGDGQLGSQTAENLTQLINYKMQVGLQSVTNQGNGQALIRFAFTAAELTSDFSLREIGIYAKIEETGVEKLYAYTNAGDNPDYLSQDYVGDEVLIDIYVIIGNASEITAVISDSNMYATVQDLQDHIGAVGAAHGIVTTSANGFMSSTDKIKLDGIETGANNYTHPIGDGNLHVPATGTSNNGKVLKAGSTAGSLSWGTLTPSDVGSAPTNHASTATTYGVSSATDYGHAMASSATPLVAGTGDAGTDNGKFAREGHVHPLQTTLDGYTAAQIISAANNIDTAIMAENGYVKLSNGIILQWGISDAVGNDANVIVNFPVAFSSACWQVFVTMVNAYTGNDDVFPRLVSASTTSAVVRGEVPSDNAALNGTRYISYFAVGN